jgi:hypothetical protein
MGCCIYSALLLILSNAALFDVSREHCNDPFTNISIRLQHKVLIADRLIGRGCQGDTDSGVEDGKRNNAHTLVT